MESALVALFTLLASFAGTWAANGLRLRLVEREVTRAHKRLDVIGAPNVTLDPAP